VTQSCVVNDCRSREDSVTQSWSSAYTDINATRVHNDNSGGVAHVSAAGVTSRCSQGDISRTSSLCLCTIITTFLSISISVCDAICRPIVEDREFSVTAFCSVSRDNEHYKVSENSVLNMENAGKPFGGRTTSGQFPVFIPLAVNNGLAAHENPIFAHFEPFICCHLIEFD